MKKLQFIVVAGIAAMTLASCGGAEENTAPEELVEVTTDETEQGESESSAEEVDTETTSASSSASDWNKLLDEYEVFMDDYVVFMKKMKDNPTDMSMLTESEELMIKSEEWSKKMEELSTMPMEYTPELAKRMQQIQAKLLQAMM